ncbi:MAG: T9SS type A sorting domain-containing protein [Ignavibacterium sp.]|nr:T9SS type A sorting domain-containing protein [Ignavibacterium sp.]
MLIKILIIASAITYYSFAQTIYEVQPGTKGNKINLTVANVSEETPVNDVEIILTRKSSYLNFSTEAQTIDLIEAKAEANAIFTFDVNRNAPINKKDTIDFMISDSNGLMMMKSFIFSYTGPKEFKLEQNYPNPFNPTTRIRYQVSSLSEVSLKVYGILGSEAATLVNEKQEPGYYEVSWDASNLASGVYIYRLQAGSFISTKKMIVLK